MKKAHTPTGMRWSGVVLALGLTASMVSVPTVAAAQSLQGIAQDWLQQQTEQWQRTANTAAKTPGLAPLRPEIEVGQLDPRLQLAACAQVEPFLPTGAKMWGRSRIGLRCVQGPVRWQVYLPIQVRMWGPAWVVRHPVNSGTVITQDMLDPAEIDWAEHPTPVLADAQDIVGLETVRPLSPGLAVRQGMVRTPEVFGTGDTVKVLVHGKGFQLTAEGKALSPGRAGETARIRMPNGRVVTATAVEAGLAQLKL